MVRPFFLLTNKATSCNSCHISWSGRFPAFIAQGDYKGERTYVGMKRHQDRRDFQDRCQFSVILTDIAFLVKRN